ncbi:MAG: LuxR C-terminal-related transcriptional regulator [Litorilinea sp.]
MERLNEGLHRKLTLISAPAGFGKTTLLGEWFARASTPQTKSPAHAVAWVSLDEGDSDPARFLTYVVAALQTLAPKLGNGVLTALQSPQPPPVEAILTALINELTTLPDNLILVLDDYHVIDAKQVDDILAFLLEHLPPRMHLVISTREDPSLPLARYRARGQMTELRATDLRFTPAEAAGFLNQVMGLALAAEQVTALEARTEGWIAGLQLAAISLQGHEDPTGFIKSFTGSHHFVLDYLVEEVLHQQSVDIQTFLLRTSILNRLCGPLCDALLRRTTTPHSAAPASGQATLETIEQANLFIVPLDNERRWYRYHHLFADLLRQRLHQQVLASPVNEGSGDGRAGDGRAGDGRAGDGGTAVDELHRRASAWYAENDLELEAFHHAAAGGDIAHAADLIEGKALPLQFRGGAVPILNWLAKLPTEALDARPLLWVTYASALLMMGQVSGVEEKAQAAETALQTAKLDDKTRDLIGRIASIRATLAATQHQTEAIIRQARRALEYLHPDNLSVRTSVTWTLGCAYQLQGDRAGAARAYTEVISICMAIGHTVIAMMATIGLGIIQEMENQLYLAAETYRRAVQLAGEPPPPPICDAYLGLARLCYQWNDLDAAHQHAQQSLQLARQIKNTDRSVICELFLARLQLAQGDVASAAAWVAKASQSAHAHNFVQQLPQVAATETLTLLYAGNVAGAAQLAQTHHLPISQARVHLAQANPSAALALLEPWRQQVEAKNWADERLRVMVLQAVMHHAQGEKDRAVHLLGDALTLAEPSGLIRLFVDEGLPMRQLLSTAAAQGIRPAYTGRLLAAFAGEAQPTNTIERAALPSSLPAQPLIEPLIEPLSQRELEVLQLIAHGFSNRRISESLFLALDTVKGHNRRIFGKLQVQRRTEAVARARELGLLRV